MSLHADARAVLASWVAPDTAQEALRSSFIDFLDARPDGMLRQCQPDHLTGSALIVRGGAVGQADVLLVHHAKAAKWLQTGGHCEQTDRTLSQAALREAREESGIEDLTVDPVPLQLSRHHVPFCGPPPRGGHHLDVQFLVHAPADAASKAGEDQDETRWFPLDADAIPEPTDQDVRSLIAAATRRLRGSP
ncbi:MAG TPA: NUDIX domain-containing protein [Aeromicrobium sp.]|nr:NUDIX domain-containing protein [Aeromicrobium sp.]